MTKATGTGDKKKKGRQPPPENETDAGRFSRLCTARVGAAVHAIDLVGNCSGNGYEYTKEQAANAVKYLQAAVDNVKEQFANGGKVAAKLGVKL